LQRAQDLWHQILAWNHLNDETLPTANSLLPDGVRSDDLGDNDQLASSGFRRKPRAAHA
jgi:hypothetical protein